MILKKSDVLISVILYNNSLDIIKIYQKNFDGYRLLFIDNSDKKKVRKSIDNLIQLDKNIGYAGAANIALDLIRNSKLKWLLILNQDLKFANFSSDKLLKALEDSHSDIQGPFVGFLDNNKWSSVLANHSLIKLAPIYYISGSFLAIKRNVINKNIKFHEPYFMYYEDVDYCIRAINAGFSISRLSISGVSHPSNGSSLKNGSRGHEYYLARNYLLFIERLAPLRIKLHVFLSTLKLFVSFKIFKKSGVLEGILDYLLRRFYRNRYL